MEECDCDTQVCRRCHYKLAVDYFEAIRLLVASGVDVEKFGIRWQLRDAIHWHNSLSIDDQDRNHGLVKNVLDNRPNR